MWPHSIRYGREVGTTMLIFIMAMAYSATSPIILPFALVYFVFTWCAPRLPGPALPTLPPPCTAAPRTSHPRHSQSPVQVQSGI